MSGTITLLCWVVGTPTKQIFPVEIARDKLWGHAKKEIKEEKKNEFADIDADTLDLWKIAICRSQRSFLESKDFLKNVMATKPLDAIDSLSTEFNDPLPHNHINIIIVKRPYKFSAADLSGDSPLRRSQASPPGEIDKVIAQCLSKYRPRMHELVMNANDIPSFLPTWQPGPSADDALKQHMSKLCIPAVKGNRPSLLLHNLGQNKTRLEKERISRIPNIFCRGEHRILINTSGSGKTRLLLDGLCHRWGFYFTADPKEVGSMDFSTIIGDLKDYQDFDRAKAMNESKLETPGSIRHVQETATRGLRQLLLSRFLLLGLLVEEVQRIRKQASSLSYRRLWVLLQVQPEQIFGNIGDPFLDLAQLLRPANASELQVRIRKNCQALSSQLNSNHELFHCVLDEAQLTADSRYRVFFSEDGLTRRPLFREIWRSWTTVLSTNQMSLIVSGTGINYAEVMRTLSSTAFKEEDYAVECDVGAFDNPYDQAEYIQLYIPADWTDMRWKEFLKRSWAWFRGRYRNTATLLSLILQAGYKSPHRTINSYVKEFTAFQPTDADDWTKQEPEHSPLPNFSKLNFDRMSNVQARTLANVLFDQALYGTYSLMSFAPEDRATFVEYGFARTKPGPTSPQTILDEPIAILAAMNWVNQNDTLSFFECLRRDIETNSKTGNGFENYFAFYVRAFFETPKSLDELFKFRSDFDKSIDWKSEEFELVTVSRTVGSGHPHISIVTPNCGPSSNIGLRAEKGEEVLSWISTNQGQFTFCFPPKHFGADLLFFIRSTVSKRLLLVMIQCKNYFEVKLQVLIEGVRTVTPDWLWKSKDIKYETAAESVFPRGCPSNASELALQTKDALRGIPLGLTVTTADFPILRVFASWEGDAKLDRSMQKIDQSAGKQTNPAPKDEKRKSRCDVDPHPLATLHLANFNRVSREMDISWFRGDVEQREVVHVKRSTSSVGLDTNTQRLKRARQEDDEMV